MHFAGPETGWAVGDGRHDPRHPRRRRHLDTAPSGTGQSTSAGVHFAGPDTGAAVGGDGLIIRSTAPNYAPRLALLDLEQNIDGNVTLIFQLQDDEGDEATVSSVEFRTDKEGIDKAEGWRSVNARPKSDGNGRWIVIWDPSEARFGVGAGNALYYKIHVADRGPPVAQVWPEGFTYQPWWIAAGETIGRGPRRWRRHRGLFALRKRAFHCCSGCDP